MTIWKPILENTSQPKYKNLADAIDISIQTGELQAGERLPPQRLLADELGVTVGTITRAYSESERRGRVIARVGSGTFVKDFKPSRYLSESFDDSYLDLHSAKAPMGLQLEMMRDGLKEIAEEKSVLETCLSYQPESAMDHQREVLANWLNGRGVECKESSLLFTYGGQHGLSISLQAICRAGDTVLCEGLSFPGISVVCQQQQLKCIGLQMDEFGIMPDSLASACLQSNPRVLYLTAQMQNPTCVQMPLERKKQIVEICKTFDVMIFDDDVQFLPKTDKLESFFELSPDNTIYISSFSKSFSGGLRVGYLISNEKTRNKIRISLRASCWTVPTLMIEILCRWLESGKMDKMELWLTNEMEQRNKILNQELAGFNVTSHQHGYNAWLVLPEHWRAVDFVAYAKNKGVLVRAAESYAIGRFPAPQNIRICICAPQNQVQLKKALEILRRCLLDELDTGELIM